MTEILYAGGEGKNFQSLLYLISGAGIPASTEANSEAGNPQRAHHGFHEWRVVQGQQHAAGRHHSIAYPWLPVNVAYVPPGEAIETVNVSTSAFDAEQGVAGGAAVNVTIKSGTNHLHGVVFERNTRTTRWSPLTILQPPRPRFRRTSSTSMASPLGGPIWIPKVVNGKNKLFFFADYQETKRRQYAAASNLTLPTSAMRTGDFSATGITIYDPFTGKCRRHGPHAV